MQYEKPEVVVTATAVSAIQGGKNLSNNRDSSQYVTSAAYEADE